MDPQPLTKESAAKRALRRLLGAKADSVPFNPEANPDARAARARFDQIRSGVVPKTGRGSNGGTTPLPEGKGWRPHVGTRQKLRGLQQNWAQFEKLCAKDEWAKATRERLLDAVAEDPSPEFTAMNIALGAKLAADEKLAWLRKNPPPDGRTVDTSWTTALNYALNAWEELAKTSKAKAEEEGAVL